MFSLSLQSLYAFSNYFISVTPSLCVPVCLYILCGTQSLTEHSIFHGTATLQSCFDTPPTQHERIATQCYSVILSLFFPLWLPCFLASSGLGPSVRHCESNAFKHRQLKMHHKQVCWYCICCCVTGKRERKTPRARTREQYDEVDTKDTDTPTHTYTTTSQVNVSLFDILMVHPDFSKQMMCGHCK